MLKVKAFFNRKKASIPFKDYYADWFGILKNDLLPHLRRSMISGSSPAVIANQVETIHHHLESYYNALDLAASNDVAQLLFPDWRNPLEKPFLWLGDLHPYLFTNLLRSFLDDDSDEDEDKHEDWQGMSLFQFRKGNDFDGKTWHVAMAWKNPSSHFIAQIEQIECGMRLMVPSLVIRMRQAQAKFVQSVAKGWLGCRGNKEGAREKVSKAMDAQMDELVSIFLDANRLRRSVLTEIVNATSEYQAALFLEGLAQFLIGFRDQKLLTAFGRCKTSLNKQSSSSVWH